ncbi:MAG TPA: Na+/H+ antiporter subunit E [Candidatus Binatia bacterium]|nr:Na+/H+ antiporter subunit E [Candidatus Binatia bacterium]
MRATAGLAAALLAFWLVLSEARTPLSLALGVVSATLVALLNRDVAVVTETLQALPRLAAYVPWLLGEIVRANLQVARVVLHPALPIDPVVVRVPAPPAGDLAVTVLGNSITLTPGTVTLDHEGPWLVVHALTARSAADLSGGAMARRVERLFPRRS